MLWVMPPCGEGELEIQICSFLSRLQTCGSLLVLFYFPCNKASRASQPRCWCLSKDLAICSNPAGVTGHNVPPRAGIFGSNLLPPLRFERVSFVNPVFNLCPDFRILTSLLFLLKWDTWPSHVLVWDWHNLVAVADCGIVHSFFIFALGSEKGKEDSLWWANDEFAFPSHLPSCLSADSESLTVHVWPSVFLLHLSCFTPPDLQGAAQYQGCPGGCRDLDWEGSHRHHHQPCADASWILQIPAAYQATCWCCAPHLVCTCSLWLHTYLYPFTLSVKFYVNVSILNKGDVDSSVM